MAARPGAVLVGLGLAVGVATLTPATYRAGTRLFVSDGVDTPDAQGRSTNGEALAVSRVRSYPAVATSPGVLEPVARRLGLTEGDLAGRVVVSTPPGTQLLAVRAVDPTAAGAAALANAVGERPGQVVEALETPDGATVPPVRGPHPVTGRPSIGAAVAERPGTARLRPGRRTDGRGGRGPAARAPQAGRPAMTTLQPAAVSVPPAAQARVAAVACLFLLVPLPVPWPITDTPFGALRWVHIGIVVLLLGYGIAVGRSHGLFGRCAPLLAVLGAMTTLAVVSAASYGAAWAEPVQKYPYALVGVVFGAAVVTALRDDAGRRILAWAGPAAMVWTATGMMRSVRAADIDPLSRLAAPSPRVSPVRSRA